MLDNLKKVMFFGAHADDEMVAAGTLHRLARQGAKVHVVTFGPSATASDRAGGNESSAVVIDEWRKSLSIIGATGSFLNFTPSAELAKFGQEICQRAYDYCENEKPDAVFTLSPDDENPAHAVVGVETERVMRGRVPLVLRCQYPWNFSLGRPNFYVKLEKEDLAAKRAVIEAYQSQKFRYDYLNLFMHDVVVQGLSVKIPAAERFDIVRAVV